MRYVIFFRRKSSGKTEAEEANSLKDFKERHSEVGEYKIGRDGRVWPRPSVLIVGVVRLFGVGKRVGETGPFDLK